MHVRDLHSDDLGVVHEINQGEVPAVGSVTADALARIDDQSLISLVAVDPASGEIGGFCMVLGPDADYGSGNFLWFRERYESFAYLDRVAISPTFQRRGIGRALYAEVERLVVERMPHATEFCLEVNVRPRNDTSLAFHDALGFVEVAQRETDYGARVSMMTKPLS